MSKVMKLGLVAVLGLAMAQAASALPLNISRVSGYHSGLGGEFTAAGTGFNANYSSLARVTGVAGAGFQTFCLEVNEYVYPPAWYDYTVDSAAINGGLGGPNPDPLSWGTAWLYSEFAAGNLTGYNYGVGRTTSAALLQDAIWWLEEEQTSYAAGNIFMTAVLNQFGSLANARADATTGAFDVYVLNLTSNQGRTLNQSMLVIVRVADGGLTVLMLGAGVMGCALIRRKLAKVG